MPMLSTSYWPFISSGSSATTLPPTMTGLKPSISRSALRHWLMACHSLFSTRSWSAWTLDSVMTVNTARLIALAGGWAGKERGGVLEVVAFNDTAEGLARRERLAVAGVDVTDFAFGDC